jgi:hypothetical protein
VNHLYAIDGRYFHAGILVNDGVIVTAAPILRYTVGWGFYTFVQYATKKNWSVIDVEIHRTGS